MSPPMWRESRELVTHPTFTRFALLPQEVRDLIWGYAKDVPIPRRIVKLRITSKPVASKGARRRYVEETASVSGWNPNSMQSACAESNRYLLKDNTSCYKAIQTWRRGDEYHVQMLGSSARHTRFQLVAPSYDLSVPALFDPTKDVLWFMQSGRRTCILEVADRWITRETIGRVRYMAMEMKSFRNLAFVLRDVQQKGLKLPSMSLADFSSMKEMFIIADTPKNDQGIPDAGLEQLIEEAAGIMAKFVSPLPEFKAPRWRVVKDPADVLRALNEGYFQGFRTVRS